jgi:hypothetical protein
MPFLLLACLLLAPAGIEFLVRVVDDERRRSVRGAPIPLVKVLQVYPGNYSTIAQGDVVYVRISYSSAQQIRFKTDVRADKTLLAGHMTTSISPPYASGSGEAHATSQQRSILIRRR